MTLLLTVPAILHSHGWHTLGDVGSDPFSLKNPLIHSSQFFPDKRKGQKQCSIKLRFRPSQKEGLPAAPHLWCCYCSCHTRLLLLDSAHLVGYQPSHHNDTRGRGHDTGKAGSSLAGAGHLTWMACHCRGLHNAGTDERQLQTVYKICRHTILLFSNCILTLLL